jgi:hypothetical protein
VRGVPAPGRDDQQCSRGRTSPSFRARPIRSAAIFPWGGYRSPAPGPYRHRFVFRNRGESEPPLPVLIVTGEPRDTQIPTSPRPRCWGFFLVRPLTGYVVELSHGRRRGAGDLNAEGRGGGNPTYRRGGSILVVEPTDHLPQAHFLPIV